MARVILNRLKFSNETIDRVCWLVANHMRVQHVEEMRVSKFRRFIGDLGFDELVQLGEADCVASLLPPSVAAAVEARKATLTLVRNDLPAPLVTGHDLIDLGFKPGPRFKQRLQEVFDHQLEGRVSTKEAALSLADYLTR